jgi:hypothetical protein
LFYLGAIFADSSRSISNHDSISEVDVVL